MQSAQIMSSNACRLVSFPCFLASFLFFCTVYHTTHSRIRDLPTGLPDVLWGHTETIPGRYCGRGLSGSEPTECNVISISNCLPNQAEALV